MSQVHLAIVGEGRLADDISSRAAHLSPRGGRGAPGGAPAPALEHGSDRRLRAAQRL
jgi:hypothetical protein